VIDDREKSDTFCVQDVPQVLDRFIHRMMTGHIDDAIVRSGFHENESNELEM